MGQTHGSGNYFHDVSVKEHFQCIQSLWSEEDLAGHIQRLKDTTLNFRLDKVKFVKLVQLSIDYEATVARWFHDFTQDRTSQVVDGLEFLSAAIMASSKVQLYAKISLLFSLFQLGKAGGIQKDEFTIFMKSITTGLHRMCTGLPPASSVPELSAISAQLFATLPGRGQGQVISMQQFLMWLTEEHYALHYVSVLSRLKSTIFTMGSNQRSQLGLQLEQPVQRVPAPLLSMEGITVTSIASHESHSLFLTQEGRIWSCGKGFCGLLGHGNISDSLEPKLVESLLHVRIVDVAVGVRHSVAVSEKGQVFTWGAADLGQLGHGDSSDQEVHTLEYDPKTGSSFAYVAKPAVVMALFGKRVQVTKVSCCNFTTSALTDQGHIYSWGNNTDGQCGQGQKSPHQRLLYLDPHMHRSAMQVISEPRLVQVPDIKFRSVSAGGYHVLAVDTQNRLWTWGQGLWGKLGHGDQQSVYEPRLVEALKHQLCQAAAAGESHSVCLCALYRLNVTGSSSSTPLSPVSYLGMPAGRVDRHFSQQKPVTPPNSDLQMQAFASAPLLQAGLPFTYYPGHRIFDPQQRVQESIVLMSRSLWEGEWLKLSTSEFDFKVKMSSTALPLAASQKVSGSIVHLAVGFDEEDCTDKICVFELQPSLAQATAAELQQAVVDIAAQCRKASGKACICILPKQVAEFDVSVPQHLKSWLSSLPIGVMSNKHGHQLAKDLACVPGAQAALVAIKEDCFLQWLKDVLAAQPKGIIVSQTSWCPDPELLELPESLFNLDTLDTPIALVSFEVGEELRSKVAGGHEPWVTLEVEQTGAVCSWGNGSNGQLGLAGIENRTLLQISQNALTGDENAFVDKPCYLAHLHEHQVTQIACGSAHTVVVTAPGEVFSSGTAEALGVQLREPYSGAPVIVNQFERLVKAAKVFAGHHHTFVLADMPFKSVV